MMNKNKKGLLLTLWQPFPVRTGGHVRTLQVLHLFRQFGYEVQGYSLLSRKKNYFRIPKSSGFGQYQEWQAYRNPLFALSYLPSVFFKWPPILTGWLTQYWRPSELREILKTVDFVILDFPYLVRCLEDFSGLLIYHAHNIENELFAGFRQKVERLERETVARADFLIGCSPSDIKSMESWGAQSSVFLPVRSNGGDFESRSTSSDSASSLLRVVFIGSDWFGNWESIRYLERFVQDHREILRQIGVQFVIVGDAAKFLKKDFSPELVSRGFVADMRSALVDCHAGINPSFSGSGAQVKLSSYLQNGLPILTTEKGLRGYEFMKEEVLLFEHESLLETLLEFSSLSEENRREKHLRCHQLWKTQISRAEQELEKQMQQLLNSV